MSPYRDPIEGIMSVILGFLALVIAVMILFGGYFLGYAVGLYGMSCRIATSQPKCVQAGWGHHVDATVKVNK